MRNPVSLINTVFNGFIPKDFADLNLLQHCYDAIKICDSNGLRPAKFSGIFKYNILIQYRRHIKQTLKTVILLYNCILV